MNGRTKIREYLKSLFSLVGSSRRLCPPSYINENKSHYVHDKLVNNWFGWLRNCNHEVKNAIEGENRFTNCYFKSEEKRVKKIQSYFHVLHQNIFTQIEKTEEKHGSYLYYYEYRDFKLPNLYRKQIDTNNEELVFNQNALLSKTGHVSLGELKISPCEKYAVLLVDQNLTGQFDGHIIKINGNDPTTIMIIKDIAAVEWLTTNIIYYVKRLPLTNGTNKIIKVDLRNRSSSEVVYEEQDERFAVHLSKSKCNKILFINIASKEACEIWYMTTSNAAMTMLWSRTKSTEAYIDHVEDKFYCLTTGDNGEYCIKSMSDSEAEWKQCYETKNKAVEFLLDMDVNTNQLLLLESHNLKPQVSVIQNTQNEGTTCIKSFEIPGILEIDNQQDDDLTEGISFTFTSIIQPSTSYKYDDPSGCTQVSSIVNTWNKDKFVYKNVEASSQDGEVIPISVFHRHDVDLMESPMICYLYGAYGVPVNLRFNQRDAYLLDHGWIIAFPHIRGGGELGRKWYHTGRCLHKENTFEDSVASLKSLHDNGISSPRLTALGGKSAGGLPVGVMLNRYSELFGAAVLEVPFVSILDVMLDDTNSLTSQEFLEWGNPKQFENHFDYISSYCPYLNMSDKDKDKPVFISISINDDRVPYWSALQWVAKRRSGDINRCPSMICRIHFDGGHFGYDTVQLQEQDAEVISFLYKSLFLK